MIIGGARVSTDAQALDAKVLIFVVDWQAFAHLAMRSLTRPRTDH